MKEQIFYSVSTDNKWMKDGVPISFYTERGAKVQPARLIGKYDVFINGRLVTHLFESQKEQIEYLVAKKLI